MRWALGWFVVGVMIGASVVYVWAAITFDIWDDDDWPHE